MEPGYKFQVQFLQNLQNTLKDGVFTSTYKFALLQSIADCCVELGTNDNTELKISVDDLAAKFIDLYWSQSAQFPNKSNPGVLNQNRGSQAAIINRILEARLIEVRLSKFKSNSQYRQLLSKVRRVVKDMPLWKLQTIDDKPTGFLYPQDQKGNEIFLFPGVSFCFRRFHWQITQMIQGAWISWIQKNTENQKLLGQNISLKTFLFESKRMNLKAFIPVLNDQQDGCCFYCQKKIRKTPEVDHFIPWSRYAVDLGHNFVLAHKTCNGDKSDFLASETHLERWHQRNQVAGKLLTTYFDAQQLPYDLHTSYTVAKWAYGQTQESSGTVWNGHKLGFGNLSEHWLKAITN